MPASRPMPGRSPRARTRLPISSSSWPVSTSPPGSASCCQLSPVPARQASIDRPWSRPNWVSSWTLMALRRCGQGVVMGMAGLSESHNFLADYAITRGRGST
ncbi:hypothetical protein PSEUDO8AS_70107 [Pseudomonas sp. 8AS]|nr:hypothetical protein PSEUDO8AS_70107 [Pseudomonas sp. 8AS]